MSLSLTPCRNTLRSYRLTSSNRPVPHSNPPGAVDILTLSGNLSPITRGWRTSITKLNEDLFSGEDEGYEYFWQMIKDDKRIKQGRRKDEIDSDWRNPEQRRRWAERMIYAIIIPTAWYAGGRSAVVLDTGKDCDEGGYLNGRRCPPRWKRRPGSAAMTGCTTWLPWRYVLGLHHIPHAFDPARLTMAI